MMMGRRSRARHAWRGGCPAEGYRVVWSDQMGWVRLHCFLSGGERFVAVPLAWEAYTERSDLRDRISAVIYREIGVLSPCGGGTSHDLSLHLADALIDELELVW